MLSESLEPLNKRLADYFGLFENGDPNFKLVWSEFETEKRQMTHTDSGVELLFPEVREVKKFSYIKDRYVLCKLTPVPIVQSEELAGAKLSYEPVWTFEDEAGNPTNVYWEAIVVLITTINNAITNAGRRGPVATPIEEQNTAEGAAYRANKLYEQLYGDESKLTDSLSNDSAVGYGIRNRK